MGNILSFLFIVSVIRTLLLIITRKSLKLLKDYTNVFIAFCSGCAYLLPIQENINFYKPAIVKIPYLNLIIPKELPYIPKPGELLPMMTDPTIFTFIGDSLKNYTSFFVFFIIYYIFIKNGKKFKINYFLRHNIMHAILIMLAQVPISYIYVEVIQVTTLSPLYGLFLSQFADSIILANFALIFYSMSYALTNRYLDLPFISQACELHIGKKPKK